MKQKSDMNTDRHLWGIKWVAGNRLDGYGEFFIGATNGWQVFSTRAEARSFRDEKYGYIKDRPDLKAEPFGWKLPRVVKVIISIREEEG